MIIFDTTELLETQAQIIVEDDTYTNRRIPRRSFIQSQPRLWAAIITSPAAIAINWIVMLLGDCF